ncbi:MAG: hypothetical protein Fur0018_23340 [Anaerolineales bacterium]
MQADGKIIIAGYDKWGSGDEDGILARVNPDGSLDISFGVGGVVTTALSSQDDNIFAVAVQPDGKIVAAGWATIGGRGVASVTRYNADGSLDTAFGSHGVVTVSLGSVNSWFLGIAVQGDGRIVASGSATYSPVTFLLARFQPDGTPDSTLGGGGVVTTSSPGGGAYNWDMDVQSDGKFVLAGDVNPVSGWMAFALARYNADGSLDAGFGSAGLVTQTFGMDVYCMLMA